MMHFFRSKETRKSQYFPKRGLVKKTSFAANPDSDWDPGRSVEEKSSTSRLYMRENEPLPTSQADQIDDDFDRLTNWAFAAQPRPISETESRTPFGHFGQHVSSKNPRDSLVSLPADRGSPQRRSSREPSPLSDYADDERRLGVGRVPSSTAHPGSHPVQQEAPSQELHPGPSGRHLLQGRFQLLRQPAQEPLIQDPHQGPSNTPRVNRLSEPVPRRSRSTVEFTATNRISSKEAEPQRNSLVPPLSNEGRTRFAGNRAKAEPRFGDWFDKTQQPLQNIPESHHETKPSSKYQPPSKDWRLGREHEWESMQREKPLPETQPAKDLIDSHAPEQGQNRDRLEEARLNKELADQTAEVKRLRATCQKLEERAKSAERKHQDSVEQYRATLAKLERQQWEYAEKTKRIDSLEQALKTAEESRHGQELTHKEHIEALERKMMEMKKSDQELFIALHRQEDQQAKEIEDLKAKHDSERNQMASHYEEMMEKHKAELEKLRVQNSKLNEQCDGFDSRMGQLVDDFDGKHKQELQTVKAQYEEKIQSLQQTHRQEIDNLKTQHHDEMVDYGNKWKQYCDEEAAQREADFRRVMSTRALVDGDMRPSSDDELKKLFTSLKLAIQTVTYTAAHPSNLGKARSHVSKKLDPTGYLQRGGRLPCLLQSVVWQKVMRAFFSAPWGFGVLGPGKGVNMLMRLYHAWLGVAVGEEQDRGELFCHLLFFFPAQEVLF